MTIMVLVGIVARSRAFARMLGGSGDRSPKFSPRVTLIAVPKVSVSAWKEWSRRSGLNGRPADYEIASASPRHLASCLSNSRTFAFSAT